MSFEAPREIPRYPEIDSLANWLTRRPAKWQETRASTLPRNQPLSPRSFYALFRTYSQNFMGGKSDLGQKGWAGLHKRINHNQHKRREKGPRREGTRERSTPAPPEAEAPSGRHLKSNTTNNVIAPGSEVNLSRLRIRPNESHP